jgi:hypothetical protein
VFDLSDAQFPVRLSKVDTGVISGQGLTTVARSAAGNLLFLGSGKGFAVFDVSNPKNPVRGLSVRVVCMYASLSRNRLYAWCMCVELKSFYAGD